MNKLFLAFIAVALLTAAAAASTVAQFPASAAKSDPPPAKRVPVCELKTFASYNQLANYIRQHVTLAGRLGWYYGPETMLRVGNLALEDGMAGEQKMAVPTAPAQQSAPSEDYSRTNVQVEGVDEADIVKTDGKYLYVLSTSKISIIKAQPAEDARLVSEIEFPGTPSETFITADDLVVFGVKSATGEFLAQIYDVRNRSEPVLKRSITSFGSYVTSRLIGDYAYAVINVPVYGRDGTLEKPALPEISIDGRKQTIPPTRIQYFDVPDQAYHYTMIMAINTGDGKYKLTEKTLLTGTSQNIFVSEKNIYLTAAKAPDILYHGNRLFDKIAPLLPSGLQVQLTATRNSKDDLATKFNKLEDLMDEGLSQLGAAEAQELEARLRETYQEWEQDLTRDSARVRNTTVMHKLGIDGDTVTYLGRGEVPGQALNQFSMDEYQGFFRIATTSEGFAFSGSSLPRNNIYVLDEDLKITGRLTGLAPGERIYAARFMGKRCYLVTFRRVDPLYTIDLTDPSSPKVLGELKIPGYSDYLHPYDDRYLIGIGKEIDAGPSPVFEETPLGSALQRIVPPRPTRETGIKIALFDVMDPADPKEVAKYVIEGQGVDSIALREHKAVLFSKVKNLLAIPVTFYPYYGIEIDGKPGVYRDRQEAYVFNISPDGISLKGTVTHQADNRGQNTYSTPVKRCLYIGNVLYTVSDRLVKLNRLDDIREIKALWL
ncbi:MAG: beta-propeller domain-containing protein [Bacillota bacterium]